MAPALLPAEGAAIGGGLLALALGLLLGRPTTTFSHPGLVESAQPAAVKEVPLLLPARFRIEARIKKTGLTVIGSEDIILLGGTTADTACSGGGLMLYWSDGTIGMGRQVGISPGHRLRPD